jgi:hypothetical protein
MDSTAHRIIHQARSLLVDQLGGAGIVRRNASWLEIADSIGHGLDAEQAQALIEVTQKLFHLMVTDPSPPECQTCATALVQAPTGRPRRFCSDACRSADARARAR